MNLTSAMYSGTLSHRRFTPVEHEFSYPVTLMYLDIDEITEIFSGFLRSAGPRPAPWWFRRRDYLGPSTLSLREAVQARIDRESTAPINRSQPGPIRLLTTVRNFGVGFNPISIYYCFDRDQQSLRTIVAEVTNTPWGRRHSYVIPVTSTKPTDAIEHRFTKQLHVSPFNPMDVEYRWRCIVPDSRARVHMDARSIGADFQSGNEDVKQNGNDHNKVFFDATLNLERRTDSIAQLRRSMLGQPFVSWSTLIRIYAQAYVLWRKGAPVHDNPHAVIKNKTGSGASIGRAE